MFRRQRLTVAFTGVWSFTLVGGPPGDFVGATVAGERPGADAGDRGDRQDRDGKALPDISDSRGGRVVTLDQLPPPPAPIGQLLEAGEVRFRVGGDPPQNVTAAGNGRPGNDSSRPAVDSSRPAVDSSRPAVDSSRRGNDSQGPDGMTTYRVSFEYDSVNRWRVVGGGASRELVIAVRFLDVRWRTTHEIWLRDPISAERFWEHALVLHELDHVRISSDRSLGQRFASMLGERAELRVPLAPRGTVTSRAVQAQIDRHVGQTHQRISDLIEIRYRELDRLTAHGQRPLPPGTELEAMLGEPTAATPTPPGPTAVADGQPAERP